MERKTISDIEKLNLKIAKATGNKKINLMLELAEKYVRSNQKKLFEILDEIIKLSQKEKYKKGLIRAYKIYAHFYILYQDTEKSFEYINKAFKEAEKQTSLINEINIMLSNYHRIKGNYKEAYNTAFKAYNYFSKKKNKEDIKNLVEACNTLGILQFQQEKIESSYDFLKEGLELAEKNNLMESATKIKVNMAIYYETVGQREKALSLFLEIYRYSKNNMDDSFNANILNNISNIYKSKNDFEKAKKYLIKAIEANEKTGNKGLQAIISANLGIIYLHEKKYKDAERQFMVSYNIFKNTGNNHHHENVLYWLSELYSEWRKYKKAWEYHRLYFNVHVQRMKEGYDKKILELQTQYELHKKQKLIEKIGKKNKDLSLQLAKNTQVLKELQINNAFYNLILENTFTAILIIDKNLDIIFANSKFYHIFDTKEDKVKNLSDVIKIDKTNITKLLEENNGKESNMAITTAKGEQKYIQYKKTKFYDSNQNSYYFITLKDITLFSQYEDRLKLLVRAFEQSPTIIVITDKKGKILYVNPKFTEVTLYSQEEILNKPASILKSGKSQVDYKKLWDLITNGKEWRGRFLNKKKDGTYFWESASISPVLDDFGKVTHFIKIAEDITAYIRLEKERDELIEELKESNATKDKFFSIIAHDLKTPFATMSAFVNLINKYYDKYNKKQLKELVIELDRSMKNAYMLLENLLTWSRMKSGRMSFSPTDFDIAKVCFDIIELYAVKAAQKGIEINANFQDGLIVHADKFMIETVLRNLINNAVKFTKPKGKITVKIEEEKENYIVSVSDTGIGISQENQKKLFKIDTAYSTFGTALEKGTGLGLILCKEFVEKNGGKIWVESKENKGTVFYFTVKKSVL